MRRVVSTALLSLLAACGGTREPADLVVLGTVWTGDSAYPRAGGVAVRGDTIVAVGSRREIRRHVGAGTRTLEHRGGLVVPGFGDAHTHFVSGGFQLVYVDLRDADSPAEFVRRIAAYARGAAAGSWILGGDWDHERWDGSPLPRREWIDSVTSDRPVFVQRLDGHMGVANSAALRLAGITRATRDTAGGLIVRDPVSGEPTGVLKDNAMSLVLAAVPPPDPAALDSAVQRAMRHAASRGVTTVHVMEGWAEFGALRRARARNAMLARMSFYVPMGDWRRLADTVRAAGRGDEWLRWGGVKGFMDGSLGSTTAAFFEPYLDAPGTRGLLVTDSAQLLAQIVSADSAGLQLAIHAIGDRANAMLLGFFAEVRRRNGLRDRRSRIEHAQHLRQADIPRFAELGVIASMQPYHVVDDGRWAGNRLDTARLQGTYAFRSLLDAGAALAFGSDWTVAPLDPLAGVYAALARRTLDGRNPGGWFPGQRIAVEEALRAYTAGVARAGFAEQRVGMLRPGMLADLVVLDRDLFEVPPEEIAGAGVVTTVVGGRIVYER